MKKLITLHTGDHNPQDEKLSAKEEFAARGASIVVSIKEFKKELKLSEYNKSIKITRESEVLPEITIEFNEAMESDVVSWLRKTSIVETIDCIVKE